MIPRLVTAFAFIWAGLYVVRSQVVIGVAMLVVGAISLALVWRLLADARSTGTARDAGMPRAEFDYLIWMALGVPMILTVLIVLLVLVER
jgi:uncharacterized membrane protein